VTPEQRIAILIEDDIVLARKAGRELAQEMGFGAIDCVLITTAISELARNIFLYAGTGDVTLAKLDDSDEQIGIEVVVQDQGPGIEDLDKAMRDGYTTSNGLGLGLPGTRRLMDEFSVETAVGRGTTVRIRKWLKRR